jgi:RNA-binding protein
MPLTRQQIRHLRALAHHLKPIVMMGNKGLTENLLVELDRALENHELIKVSIAGADKPERYALTEKICQASRAEMVQLIGRVSILYRPAKKPQIVIP